MRNANGEQLFDGRKEYTTVYRYDRNGDMIKVRVPLN